MTDASITYEEWRRSQPPDKLYDPAPSREAEFEAVPSAGGKHLIDRSNGDQFNYRFSPGAASFGWWNKAREFVFRGHFFRPIVLPDLQVYEVIDFHDRHSKVKTDFDFARLAQLFQGYRDVFSGTGTVVIVDALDRYSTEQLHQWFPDTH